MRILVLAAGSPERDDDRTPPVWLDDGGGPIIMERMVQACASIKETRFVFAVRDKDIRKFNVDSVIALAAPGAAVVRVFGLTGGAACTALLAISHIGIDEPLLILNANEFLEADYADIIASFVERDLDAGVVTFPSIHPRYSYVRLDEDGLVTQAAEKRPISRHATAGFYWFRRGGDFVAAACEMIRKDAHVEGNFFICPVFNEMILKHAKIGISVVQASAYHPLKSQRQVDKFEAESGARLR